MTPDDRVRRLLDADGDALAWCAVRGHAPEKLAALLAANYHRIVGEIARNFATLEREMRETAERLDALYCTSVPRVRPVRPVRHRHTLGSRRRAKA